MMSASEDLTSVMSAETLVPYRIQLQVLETRMWTLQVTIASYHVFLQPQFPHLGDGGPGQP